MKRTQRFELEGMPTQDILASDKAMIMPGNCFQAAVAGVLGIRLNAVPHFALLGMHHWMHAFIAWLNVEHECEIDTTNDDKDWPNHKRLQYCIVRGVSKRGIGHAVIGLSETGEIVHDPHPSREGLSFINSRFYFYKKQPEVKA